MVSETHVHHLRGTIIGCGKANLLIELITVGLSYLATYITGVITLKILTPTDLNYMETIFSTLGPFSKTFTLFTQLVRKLSGYK